MTTDITEISDIFSIFHDGVIAKCEQYNDFVLLHIGCMYLAERINKDFDSFLLKIHHFQNLELKTWPRESDNESRIIDDINIIFLTELDIYRSEVKNNMPFVYVGQNSDHSLDYVGGDLVFSCSGVEIFDQDKNPISYHNLVTVCKSYWDDFENRK